MNRKRQMDRKKNTRTKIIKNKNNNKKQEKEN